jgi:hypothetical protein
MKQMIWMLAGVVTATLAAGEVQAAWTKRMGNLQNTNDVGNDPALTPANAKDLKVVGTIPVKGEVNGTPVISDGLLFVGDGGTNGRFVYVVDLVNGNKRLIQFDTGATANTPLIGQGMQSTAVVGTVTVPNGAGGTKEERRVYFGSNVKPRSFWCLNVDKILADRAQLDADSGKGYICEGADWPIIIAGLGDIDVPGAEGASLAPLPVYNASPTFSQDQDIYVGATPPGLVGIVGRASEGKLEKRDVIFTPTIGADCSDGQLWAVDAYTAEVLWIYDPVPNFQDVAGSPGSAGPGYGGMIWTVPALSKDKKHIYVTTGDCVEQPQIGFQAESLVAIDPTRGVVQWWHQRRLTDTTDYDIGNSPVVVDVEGTNGCHNIVSTDKNGCIYGFSQEGDIPQVGQEGYDPTRIGQQRVRWRQCFTVGSLNGGFNASSAAAHDRWAFAISNGSHAPNDTANAFAVDACDGTFQWADATVGTARSEGAIASGMWFAGSGSKLQVLRAAGGAAPQVLATVALPSGFTSGGGGPAIVDGTVYVPVKNGVALVRVVPGSGASLPKPAATVFAGPYPVPLGTGVEQVNMPLDPYDPNSPPAPAVADWPSMKGARVE